jgi:hypothetical protein
MDEDETDVERVLVEGGALQHLDDRPDGVVRTEVVVEPQLIQPSTSIRVQERNSGRTRTRHLGTTAIDERAQIVYQHGAGRRGCIHTVIILTVEARRTPVSCTVRVSRSPLSQRMLPPPASVQMLRAVRSQVPTVPGAQRPSIEGQDCGMQRFDGRVPALVVGEKVRVQITSHERWGVMARVVAHEDWGASADAAYIDSPSGSPRALPHEYPAVETEVAAVIQRIDRYHPPFWLRLTLREADLRTFRGRAASAPSLP